MTLQAWCAILGAAVATWAAWPMLVFLFGRSEGEGD